MSLFETLSHGLEDLCSGISAATRLNLGDYRGAAKTLRGIQDRAKERAKDKVNVHSIDRSKLQNGDVIRVKRSFKLLATVNPILGSLNVYDHYGIYVSEGDRVIHYTGDGGGDFNGVVQETSLSEFLDGAEEFFICRFPKCYSGEETVRRARSKLGQGGYNLVSNNCEHFAVWCKTGESRSSQVNEALVLLSPITDPILPVIASKR